MQDGSYALLVAYESTMFPTLGDMQSLLFTNMAVAMSQDGLLEDLGSEALFREAQNPWPICARRETDGTELPGMLSDVSCHSSGSWRIHWGSLALLGCPSGTLDPVWKFDCEMASMKISDTIEFQVMDYDAIGSDDLLGTLELTFDQIYPSGVDDTFELTDPARKDGKVATIKLKIMPESIQMPVRDTRCWVTVQRAEGLRAADWSLVGGGKSDPYCIVGIPHKKHSTWRTCILYKELNPTWDEEDEMINYEPGDNLKFQVMDYDKKDQDDHLGSALLQSGDFHPDGFEGELSIGEGTLHIKVDIELPEEDEEVNDPASHVGPRDREPAPFQLRSMDTHRSHRLVAYTRVGRSRRLLEEKIDLVLDSPGNCDVSRLHAIIKCWRGPDPNTWLARIYDEKGIEGGPGAGPGGGHSGGGTTVDGEMVDPILGTALETGSVLRFGVREMWVFERAPMHLRSQDAEIACNRAAANSQEDPALIRSLKIPSNAVDSALQRCPDWFSIVRVVLECRLEPDEPACVDCIETQDECGRTVGRHEAYTLVAQQKYDIHRILREIKVGGTVRLRLSNDPKLLAPILEYLDKQRLAMQEVYESRAHAAWE
eukprot:s1454_g6.t1